MRTIERYFIILALALISVTSCTSNKGLDSLTSHYIDKDGVKVHYKVSGNGPMTITFVHGFGCDMNSWAKQYLAFKNDKNLRLVFVDLPGYGKSDKPETDYTLQFYADAVSSVLDTLGVGPSILVGHSLGTPVCRQMFLTSVHSMGLLDIDGVYCFYSDDTTKEYLAQIDAFSSSFDGDDCKEAIGGFVQSLTGPGTPQEIIDYSMSTMPQTPQYVASSTMHNLVERKWWHSEIVFPQPISVICTQNSGLDPDNQQKMEALYSDLDYMELQTCGHFIMMEEPELVNAAISKIIDRVKKASLEDYDYAVNQIEQNYAAFRYKVTEGNLDQWNSLKQELRNAIEKDCEYTPAIISDLCAWFNDFHLYCSFRYDSEMFPRDRTLYMNEMDWYAPEATSKRVDDNTWLLRFPTWDGDDDYVAWVNSAVEEYKKSGCENLIIDERSNGGGSDWQYYAVLDIIFKQDGLTDGMMLRNTKDNRDRTIELVKGDEYWSSLMEKGAQSPDSAYVTLFSSSHMSGTVSPRRPKRAAVIIDNQVGSSGEQFLLDIRAIAPDVKFYGKDHTLGCIDVSNVRVAPLSHYPNGVYIPTTISYRALDGRGIDGKGIYPDVKIDIALPDTLTNNIDSWTKWVAEDLKK